MILSRMCTGPIWNTLKYLEAYFEHVHNICNPLIYTHTKHYIYVEIYVILWFLTMWNILKNQDFFGEIYLLKMDFYLPVLLNILHFWYLIRTLKLENLRGKRSEGIYLFERFYIYIVNIKFSSFDTIVFFSFNCLMPFMFDSKIVQS